MAQAKYKSKEGSNCTMCEVSTQQVYLSEEKIIKTLKERPFIKWCYILHDKDTNEDGTLKAPHWHIFVKLANGRNFGEIAEWFGVPVQQVEKIKCGRYDGAVPYCIHKNNPEKYQYSPEEVKASFDYLALLKKQDKKFNYEQRKKEIIEQIAEGTIRIFNLYEHITPYEYTIFKKEIDRTFEYRRNAIANEQRKKEVIFIQGDSQVGKTTYAKKLATDKGYSFKVSGASNDPLEGYEGQDCLILDDLRGSSQRLEDLLKMLDNHTSSMAKSRYHNKILECKLIIITSTQGIETFFSNLFMEHPESIVQLKRRCKTYLQMTEGTIFVSFYDEVERDYKIVTVLENPIQNLYPAKALDEEEINRRLEWLLGNNKTSNETNIDNKAEENEINEREEYEQLTLFDFIEE